MPSSKIIFKITVNTPVFGKEELKCWEDIGRTTFEIIKREGKYEVWSDNGFSEIRLSVLDTKYQAMTAIREFMKAAMKVNISTN